VGGMPPRSLMLPAPHICGPAAPLLGVLQLTQQAVGILGVPLATSLLEFCMERRVRANLDSRRCLKPAAGKCRFKSKLLF